VSTRAQKTQRWIILASALLGLLLAIIAYVIWTDTQPAQQANTAAGAKRSGVNKLRIVRPGFPDMVLSRTADTWRITEPCSLAVNEPRLEPLMTLVNPTAFSYSALEVDLDAAGLATPQATLYFNDEQVDIGNTDLTGERRYIRREDQVEFAPEWVLSLVSGGLSAFADLAVFPTTLQSVVITKPSEGAEPLEGIPSEWQSLTAQQIVTLPLPESDSPIDAWTLSASSANAERLSMTVYRYASFAALVNEGSLCAFVISANELPGQVVQ